MWTKEGRFRFAACCLHTLMKYTIQVVSKLRGDGAVVVLQHGIVCPAYPTDSFHEKELHGDGTCGAEAVQCGKLTAKTSSGVADFFRGIRIASLAQETEIGGYLCSERGSEKSNWSCIRNTFAGLPVHISDQFTESVFPLNVRLRLYPLVGVAHHGDQ